METNSSAIEVTQLQEDIARIKADLTMMRRDMTNLAEDAFHAARAGADNAKSQVADKAKAARSAVGKQLGDHPFITVGSALGVGLILGIVLGKSRC